MALSASGRILLSFASVREFLLEYADGISKGVVFVPTNRPGPFGNLVDFDLLLPGTKTVLALSGNVVVTVTAREAERTGKRAGMGVRFQKLEPDAERALVEFVRAQQQGRTGRVLLVDDDALVLAQVGDVLSAEGFAVTTSTNAIRALEIMKTQPFDLVVADVNMPRMDGFEFRDHLREEPSLAGVAFAFLTADGRDEARKIAAQLGVRRFLVKPFVPEQLLRIAREAAAESAARRSEVAKPWRKAAGDSRRLSDIAYRKLTALGMACRYSADGQIVEGDVMFRPGRLVHAFTRAGITSGTVQTVQNDRVVFVKPDHLRALPPFAIHDFADGGAFETAVSRAYIARAQDQEKAKRVFMRFSIPVVLDEPGFRAVGRIAILNDKVDLALADAKTLRIEAVNGRAVDGVIPDKVRFADISEATSAIDVELVLEPVVAACKAALERVPVAPPPQPKPAVKAPPPVAPRPVAESKGAMFAKPGEFDLSEEEPPAPPPIVGAPVVEDDEFFAPAAPVAEELELDAEPEPDVAVQEIDVAPEPEPEPEVVAEPEPVAEVAPEPVAAVVAEPEPEVVAEVAPEPGPEVLFVPPEIPMEPEPPAIAAPEDAPADSTDPVAPGRVEMMCATCGGAYTVGLESDERMLTECPACIRMSHG